LASPKDPSCTSTGGASSSSASGRSSGVASAGAASGGSAARAPRLNGFALAALLNPDVYVEVVDDAGTVVFSDPSGPCARPDPVPALPAHLPVQALPLSHVFGRNHGRYVPDRPSFDVRAVGVPGLHYRAQAVAVPGGTLLTAIALDPTDQTLTSLTHVELAVSIVVVVALLVLVLWIVRFGLRPLEDMTETAGAIAGGDLTRRIRRTDERSEVGRLGGALNGMLSQIEAAFHERSMSESRLRRFVADASHELRTPLTSIRGYAELLRKGAFNDEDARLRASERIEHEAARMSVLVDDLLLLARLDQGRPLERSAVDVAELVSDAVEAARAVDPGRPISLEGHDSILVEGDAVRLRQIVDNLLHNAEVHTQPGTPVHLRVTRVGESAVITVADEGLGLDAEEQARVFDRFYRGSEARTGGGTGLGLSIVAALAVAHGGQAHVASVPGQGTTFTVELPALGQSVEGGSSPEEEPSSSAGRMAGARVGERGVGPARR
ncbi:MAG: HAMP domain-containing sensor histidine kinase, partial [Acidimicrobiales bacterium]